MSALPHAADATPDPVAATLDRRGRPLRDLRGIGVSGPHAMPVRIAGAAMLVKGSRQSAGKRGSKRDPAAVMS